MSKKQPLERIVGSTIVQNSGSSSEIRMDKVLDQAIVGANLLLGVHGDPSNISSELVKVYRERWWSWMASASSGKRIKFQDGFLPFLEGDVDFREILEECKNSDGTYCFYTFVKYLPHELSETLAKSLNLGYDPRFNASQVYNEYVGLRLDKFIEEKYGIVLGDEDSIDKSDLLHAAFPGKFDIVKDSHMIDKLLGRYLNSSNGQRSRTIYTPGGPSLDSVIAFFNSYDDKKVIEEILYSIEKRRIFNTLADATKHYTTDNIIYKSVLNSTLDNILVSLTAEHEKSNLDGARRILKRVITHYQTLKDFSLEGIRTDLDGCAFPRFYQAEAIAEIYTSKRLLIADEMGTGKTASAVLASRYIQQQEIRDGKKRKGKFKTLVVTTNTNKYSFKEKIQEYLGLAETDLKTGHSPVVILNGGNREAQYKKIGHADFVIVNYELLRARDWKLADFMEWEVESETVLKYRAELSTKFKTRSRSRKTELEFVVSQIRSKACRSDIKDLDQAYLAYAKERDLNEAKSVAKRLEDHFKPNYVIVDEVQNAKRDSSLNAKAVLHVTKNAEYVACLSGTIFVNGLSDLNVPFTVLGVYDEMIRSQESKITKLEKVPSDSNLLRQERETLAKLKKYVGNGDVQSILLSNPRMVRDYLRPKMIRRKSNDVLDMPELIIHPETCGNYENMLHLPMNHRIAYQILQSHDFRNSSDQLRALQMYLLSPGLYMGRFVPARNSRGEIIGIPPKLPSDVIESLTDESSVKYNYLEEIIRKVNADPSKVKKNLIVFSSLYRVNVTDKLEKMFQERFPEYSVLRIDGEIIDTERDKKRKSLIDLFNASEKPTILFATLATMKEAVELHHRCSTVVNLDLPFTHSEYSQGVARVWRANQNEKVDAYNLIIGNSLDVGKWDLIQAKKRLGELLLIGAPLNKEELNILDLNEGNAVTYGFIESFIKERTTDSLKIMRDLFGAGRDNAIAAIGSRCIRSEVYADGYLINGLSDASLKDIFRDIIRISDVDESKLHTLDGKICDLAAAYGKFSHATGIATENLEINPVIIDRAKDFVASGTRYTHGPMQDVNKIYGSNRFEHIIFSLAFHYASDEERGKLLLDLHATLKDKGYLYLTEPLASIDNEGRKNLVEALKYTGYQVVYAGESKVEDKKFFKVIAKKNGQGVLFNKSFALRTYDKPDFDPDEVGDARAELKEKFSSTDNANVSAGLEWRVAK